MPVLRSALPALLFTGCVTNVGTTEVAAPEADAPGAYMIVLGKNYDPAALGPYIGSLPPIYAKYGGRYIALSTDVDFAEGRDEWQSAVISAWPDANAARAFWDGPEYREAIKLREGLGEFDVMIVPALP